MGHQHLHPPPPPLPLPLRPLWTENAVRPISSIPLSSGLISIVSPLPLCRLYEHLCPALLLLRLLKVPGQQNGLRNARSRSRRKVSTRINDIGARTPEPAAFGRFSAMKHGKVPLPIRVSNVFSLSVLSFTDEVMGRDLCPLQLCMDMAWPTRKGR